MLQSLISKNGSATLPQQTRNPIRLCIGGYSLVCCLQPVKADWDHCVMLCVVQNALTTPSLGFRLLRHPVARSWWCCCIMLHAVQNALTTPSQGFRLLRHPVVRSWWSRCVMLCVVQNALTTDWPFMVECWRVEGRIWGWFLFLHNNNNSYNSYISLENPNTMYPFVHTHRDSYRWPLLCIVPFRMNSLPRTLCHPRGSFDKCLRV